MRNILASIIIFVNSALVTVVFATSTTYLQLIAATVLYFLLIFLAFIIFPRKIQTKTQTKSIRVIRLPIQPTESDESVKKDILEIPVETTETSSDSGSGISISDIDKRAFLKIVAGAGISLFLFSIFNRKTDNLFAKGIQGSGRVILEDTEGNKISPAQNQPTDGYRISEIDDNIVSYNGFLNKDGAWYIMQIDTQTGSFRYAKGDSNFPNNWANRENLKYDYYNVVF